METFFLVSIIIIFLLLFGIIIWLFYFLPIKIKYYANEEAKGEIMIHELFSHNEKIEEENEKLSSGEVE